MASSQKHGQRRFFKLASVKSVEAACVYIIFFFHCSKYGQNIFSITTVLYLIAKVEITLYLKHEIILYQKEKGSKIFQVKTISKYVRKAIVPSFMFLFNLSKSVVLCVKKM